MTTTDKFHEFIKSLLSEEKEDSEKTLIVRVTQKIKVAVLKNQLTQENKKIFCEFVKVIPRIRDGLSAKDLTGFAYLYIYDHQAIIVQGVGHALGAWELVCPFSSQGIMLEKMGLMPMNKGLMY